MKKVLVVFVMVFALVALASAQDVLEKGNYVLGGSVSFNSSGGDLYENSDGDGTTSLWFGPAVSYFIMDNISVGSGISFSTSSQGDNKGSSFGISPRAAYYFNQMGPGFPFAQVGFSWDSNKDEYPMTVGTTTTTVENKYTTSSIDIGAGYLYFLNEKIGATGMLNYSMDSNTPDGGDSVSGSNLSIRFGFRMFL